MTNWLRMEEGNDWGYVYLAMPGKKQTEHGMACAQKLGIKLRKDALLRTRFPDGSVREYPIGIRMHRESVGDHGQLHTTEVRSDRYGIHVEAMGFKDVWISLTKVEVDAESLERARE